jgi:hypothetical protein
VGSVPDHKGASPEVSNSKQRKAELLKQAIETAAKAVAIQLRCPWQLVALREHARQHVSQPSLLGAWKEHDRSSGFKFPHQAYIRKVLLTWSKGRPASPPSEESVREAYEAFTKEEWTNRLIPNLDRATLRPLLLYLQANKNQLTRAQVAWLKDSGSSNTTEREAEELDQRIRKLAAAAWRKYSAVYEAAAKRSMILLFSQGDWERTPISDPLWAALWEKVGAPRTSKHRTPAELYRPRAIAEALGYDPDNKHKQVAEWLERMEQLPFEEFVKTYGGDLSDYLTWVRRPRLYNKIQSVRKQRGE